MDDIKIIRAPHTADRPYFSMSRAAAQDTTLSFEARGMLAYLLSKPDDWSVAVKDLQQNCGRDKARSILKELQAHGYLSVEQQHDSKGKFTRNVYRVHESPLTENPSTDSPSTGNPTLTNNRSKQSTDKQPIAPDGAAQPSKPKPKAERPRDLIFDAVALGSFGLRQVKGDKTTAARIAKVSNWLKQQENVTAERVAQFYEWYAEENEHASAPRDVSKFAVWWAKFDDRDAADDDPYATMFSDENLVQVPK